VRGPGGGRYCSAGMTGKRGGNGVDAPGHRENRESLRDEPVVRRNLFRMNSRGADAVTGGSVCRAFPVFASAGQRVCAEGEARSGGFAQWSVAVSGNRWGNSTAGFPASG
jgi:hypothetical protein